MKITTTVYVFLGDYHPMISFARILENVTRHKTPSFGDYVILATEKDEMYDEKNINQFCMREYDTKILDVYETMATENLTDTQVYQRTIGSEQVSHCSSILVLAPTPENAEVYDTFVEKVWEQNQKFPVSIPKPPSHLGIQVS